MPPEPAKTKPEPDPLQAGRRISLFEMSAWFLGLSVALAIPTWFNLSLLPILFYGTFAALAWRLSKAMSSGIALFVALTTASLLAYAYYLVGPK